MFSRVLGIGLAWTGLWIVAGIALSTVIGIVDPDSIDPGDFEGMLMVFGSMGFFSGLAFAILVSLTETSMPQQLSIARVALWGTLGTAIAQLGYLNHGDAGLIANLQMALLFSTFGAPIAILWLLIARRRSSWRSAHPAGH